MYIRHQVVLNSATFCCIPSLIEIMPLQQVVVYTHWQFAIYGYFQLYHIVIDFPHA